MDFSHYTTKPVEMAVALVNTQGTSTDALTERDDLASFLEPYRDLWEGVTRAPSKTDLAEVRKLRSSLREVIESPDEESASSRVNSLLDEYGAKPRVSLHSGEPHLHFEPTESSVSCWLGATTAMGLASVIVEHGLERFGVCDSATCDDVYVDTSRNRSRRHCSNTCSTREAVAAYRKRQTD